jgi:hypothetical protein
MEQRACAEPEQLAQEIAALTSLSVKALKGCWRSLYGSEPHRGACAASCSPAPSLTACRSAHSAA